MANRLWLSEKPQLRHGLITQGGLSDPQQTHLSHSGGKASSAPAEGASETPGVQGPTGVRTRLLKAWTRAWVSARTEETARPGSPQTRAGPDASSSAHLPGPLASVRGRESSLWVGQASRRSR